MVTAEVVRAFREEDIASILLKGPAMARWLYKEGAVRSYGDADILLHPDSVSRAEAILRRLGFERQALEAIPGDWPKHAREWSRDDGGNIDLHQTLVGVGVHPSDLWEVLWKQTEKMQVGGESVDVPNVGARALLVTLHAAKDGGRVAKVRHDLGHALEREALDVWQQAADLAARLQATGAFAAGLRRSPEGKKVAEFLALPDETPVEIALRAHGAPPLATGIDWLVRTPGVRGKFLVMVRKLVPPPDFMRAWSSLARRGRHGLALAYVWRPIWVLWRTGPAIWAWLKAYRVSRTASRPRLPDE